MDRKVKFPIGIKQITIKKQTITIPFQFIFDLVLIHFPQALKDS